MLVFAKAFDLFFGSACPSSTFFGIPNWWKYIPNSTKDPVSGKCVPVFDFPDDIWAVALAVIDMLLYLAGMVAVVMIIIAGVSYITAGGSPEKAASARRRIYNSLIGLGIAVIAISLVTFIGKSLGN